MKPVLLAISVVAFVVGGAITFAIVRWLDKGSPHLAFIVGAILSTQAAAILHYRSPDAISAIRTKLSVGTALAITAAVFGLVVHFAFAPFEYVEVSIPVAAIGCFIFPLILFDTMGKALSKKRTP